MTTTEGAAMKNQPPRDYILDETTWHKVRGTSYNVAILPWGATEAHNFHLPYGTDSVQCAHIAAESARIATDGGASVVVLPTTPFGVNTQQLDIPLTLNVFPSTQAALLRDLVRSISVCGVEKLVVLNGHGGNEFRSMIRELQVDTTVFICTVNWWEAVDPDTYFDEAGDHAGELETSLMMHLEPTLVLPLGQAGAGQTRAFRIAALRERWAWAPRQWTKITDDTGVGNPARATAEKGRAYYEAVTAKIGAFLIDLSATSIEEIYESK
jgi:creatinine amidohydrolase